jgi:hypothetical protein
VRWYPGSRTSPCGLRRSASKEALNVTARSTQVVQHVKEAPAQPVRGVGVKMTAVGGWSNADKEDADSVRRCDIR